MENTKNIKETLTSLDGAYSNSVVVTDKEEKMNYLMPTLEKMYSEINPNQVTLKNNVIYFNSSETVNDNAYPFQLIDLMKEASATHTSCLNLRIDLAIGNGLEPINPSQETQDFLDHVNKMGDNWQKIWEKICYDYQTHGMYSLQLIYNREGKIVEVYHVDISTVRAQANVEEEFLPYTSTWLLSRKWAEIRNKQRYTPNNSAVKIKSFNPQDWSKDGGRQLLVSKKYQSGNDVYSLPHYNSVIKYIKLDNELAKFHLNKVAGGFFPNVIVQLAGNPNDEEKQRFKNKFISRYKGSDKEKIMFIWNEGDDTAPKIIPFNTNDDTDVFEILDRITTQKILSAHQIVPDLASLPSQGQSLGGDANKLFVARQYTIETVIKPDQKAMLNDINLIFKHNDLEPVTVTNEVIKLTPEDNAEGNAPATN